MVKTVIDIFNASAQLQTKLQDVANERALVQLVIDNIHNFEFSTQVRCSDIDIAFAASGGKTHWLNSDSQSIECSPPPSRHTAFGDILIEHPQGYVNLATPAGFIPLVDVVYSQGKLSKKCIN